MSHEDLQRVAEETFLRDDCADAKTARKFQQCLLSSVQRVVRRIVRNRRSSSRLGEVILAESEKAIADYPSVSFSDASSLTVLLARRIFNKVNLLNEPESDNGNRDQSSEAEPQVEDKDLVSFRQSKEGLLRDAS